MHVLIIEFRLRDISEEGYRDACAQLAPAVAEVPGLLAKFWIADDVAGTRGGVYVFRDRSAVEAFTASELFGTVAAFPHFTDVSARDLEVLDDLTRRTMPGLRPVDQAVAS